MPSSTDAAAPAMNSDAPALSSTTSRAGPRAPPRIPSMIRAFSCASPPFSDAGRRLRQPDVGRVQIERVDRAVAALGDLGVAGGRELVDAVGAVHDPGALGSEQHQRPRHQLGELRPRHADQLTRRARRIGQRPEQVERRPHAELAAHRRRHAASTDETSARRRTRCRASARQRSTTAGEAVIRTPSASKTSALPDLARGRAVAVLGDAHARRRDDERGARRDVERVRPDRRPCRRCRTRRRSASTPAPRAPASSAPGRRSRPAARPSSPGRSAARQCAPARRGLP